ncbi:UDP-N-acetylmuramoyl-L-alanyl-D-glutamate--2,6-diaminopimelate ligase [Athalassotoga sp.]|uniref:UDP-N-acetylmuramoyl-L-alanyl-D-glutamate--2, 6-diaminopimelate ligase n=1 Tax=Athalassotoga sp. TaxID=2022597 RepID=UPI003D0037D4
MRFSEIVGLLSKYDLVKTHNLSDDPEIKDISEDSRKTKINDLFICVKGSRFDSHTVANSTNASALICQYEIKTDKPYVIVKDIRLAISITAYNFYGPFDNLRFFAVTGTKGKTSAATLFKEITNANADKCALMTTVVNSTPNFFELSDHTTQSPLYFAQLLKRSIDEGAKFASLEASSQGLDMKRLDGLSFDRIAFLNLTRDHFDTHMNFENYFEAKAHLLDLVKSDGIVFVNSDAGKWSKLYAQRGIDKGLKVVTYGTSGDIKLKVTKADDNGTQFRLKIDGEDFDFSSTVIGDFMAYDMTASVLAAVSFGIGIEVIQKAVNNFAGVEGRLERHHSDGYDFYIDYAHTPAALEAVLKFVRKLTQGRVIVVFGAGGDADRGKRPLMGSMVQKYSDLMFLTNDNPKSEDPLKIIDEVMNGISDRSKLHVVPDRKQAIEMALKTWKAGDKVVIAGKGHERVQIFNGYEVPFKDRDVAFEILKGMGRI